MSEGAITPETGGRHLDGLGIDKAGELLATERAHIWLDPEVKAFHRGLVQIVVRAYLDAAVTPAASGRCLAVAGLDAAAETLSKGLGWSWDLRERRHTSRGFAQLVVQAYLDAPATAAA